MQEVMITGNLGKDAEVIRRKDGKEVLTFSVAVSNGKEANGEDRKPTWYGVFVMGSYDNLAPYLVRGTRVLVRGRLGAGAWTNRQGETVISLDVSTSPSGVEIQKFAEGNKEQAVQDDRPF